MDEKQVLVPRNYVLRNGEATLGLEANTAVIGTTNTFYFDRSNSVAAASEARCMDRLDVDLRIVSFLIAYEDQEKLAELAPEGLTLKVKGDAILDARGQAARDAVYTAIPRVDFYTQFYTSKAGIVIKADNTVAYDSLVLAAEMVDVMLSKEDTKIAEAMKDFGCSLAVYSPHQNAYFLPEHRYNFSTSMYDVEGYGGNIWNGGVSSIAERNILRTVRVEDMALTTNYWDENILIHEFGRCVI